MTAPDESAWPSHPSTPEGTVERIAAALSRIPEVRAALQGVIADLEQIETAAREARIETTR